MQITTIVRGGIIEQIDICTFGIVDAEYGNTWLLDFLQNYAETT